MTQRSSTPTVPFIASPHVIPTHSYDCHSWTCVTRELEQSSTDRPQKAYRRQPSPLLMAAGLLTAVLVGSATVMQVQQATTHVLAEASADFAHHQF